MGDDICPYVFCPKCKQSNSWVRYKAKDITGQDSGGILWKGWQCKYCSGIALEPTEIVKSEVR